MINRAIEKLRCLKDAILSPAALSPELLKELELQSEIGIELRSRVEWLEQNALRSLQESLVTQHRILSLEEGQEGLWSGYDTLIREMRALRSQIKNRQNDRLAGILDAIIDDREIDLPH